MILYKTSVVVSVMFPNLVSLGPTFEGFLAHLNRRLTRMAMLWRPSIVVRPAASSTISEILSETAWPVKTKLHVEHP